MIYNNDLLYYPAMNSLFLFFFFLKAEHVKSVFVLFCWLLGLDCEAVTQTLQFDLERVFYYLFIYF